MRREWRYPPGSDEACLRLYVPRAQEARQEVFARRYGFNEVRAQYTIERACPNVQGWSFGVGRYRNLTQVASYAIWACSTIAGETTSPSA